jgi:hypothetical protein
MGRHSLRRFAFLPLAAIALISGIAYTAPQSEPHDREAAPLYGITIPAGYRDWKVVSVAHEAGNLNDLRTVLGNDVAIKAYRKGKLPFPDGAMIARLAWKCVPSEENNKALGHSRSFVPGSPTNLEFMVKDSQKYASTAGWGFAQFTDGKPDSEALHKTCFSCHGPAKDHDFLFTRYAP